MSRTVEFGRGVVALLGLEQLERLAQEGERVAVASDVVERRVLGRRHAAASLLHQPI